MNIIIPKIDFTTAESIYEKTQIDYALQRLEELLTEFYIPLPSEWAEENRILPPGTTDDDGPFDPAKVPHLMPVLNHAHPDDPATHIYLMANAQSGKTVSVLENIIGFAIKYKLGSILSVTSTKNIQKMRGSYNIDTLIDWSGLAELVKPLSDRTGRKKGDSSFYKEFVGGIKMLMTSYGSAADTKSNTFHIELLDEIDEAGTEIKDLGDIEDALEARTKGVNFFKIFGFSTPTRMETSRIYRNFLRGDQNHLHLPCPECGDYQELELKKADSDYGLTFRRETDKETGQFVLVPGSVRYICKHCGKEFYESKKSWMLENYLWKPHNTAPADDKVKSYYSPGLAAPMNFLGWERICRDYINTDCGKDVIKFKGFMMNDIGWPWMSTKKIMSWEKFRDRAEDYMMGEVPEGQIYRTEAGELYRGPLYLLGGCDVQGDRLELHIIGVGPGMEVWSIDYKVFPGNPANANDQCWSMLSEWVLHHSYSILGVKVRISCCAIDCGWDPNKNKGVREKDFPTKSKVIYDFIIRKGKKFIPVMGIPEAYGIELIKPTKINSQTKTLTTGHGLYVSAFKDLISANLELDPGENAIHFPRYQPRPGGGKQPIPDEHYMRFLSERYQEDPKKPGTFGWFTIHTRNEQWDTFIYAYATAIIFGLSVKQYSSWVERYKQLLAEKSGK